MVKREDIDVRGLCLAVSVSDLPEHTKVELQRRMREGSASRPVVEAAEAFNDEGVGTPAHMALIDAVDAYREATHDR